MHALPARPLKAQGGRGSGKCADGTTVINLISLCSHPDLHPNLNREVCRRLTWHSSESESALERFEPVAAVKLRLDGSLAMFAPEGDGCLQRAKREDAGRFSKEGKSLDDFLVLLVMQKYDIRKVSLCFFAGEQCSPLLSGGRKL